MSNIKAIDLTFEDLDQVLDYDYETGKFTWKIAPNRRIAAGTEAGIVKATKPGGPMYRYIGYQGVQTPAARVAWLLSFKEWPPSNIQFYDGDTLNLRLENLKLAQFPTEKVMKGSRRVYKMSKEAARHYGLKRYYGLSGEEYGRMLADQKGVCAICEQPETAMFNGQPKVMHVDHDHVTGQVRALLCGCCNGMLGLAKDDPKVLRAAALYIETRARKITPLRAEEA